MSHFKFSKHGFNALFACLTDCLVVFVFLASSVSHIKNPYWFLGAIYEYQLFSPVVGQFLAICVPWLQASIAFLICIRLWLTETTLLAAALLFSFFLVQSLALMSGKDISCGCFGPNGESITWRSIGVVLFTCVAVSYVAYVRVQADFGDDEA